VRKVQRGEPHQDDHHERDAGDAPLGRQEVGQDPERARPLIGDVTSEFSLIFVRKCDQNFFDKIILQKWIEVFDLYPSYDKSIN
jgi:hypothetical protein